MNYDMQPIINVMDNAITKLNKIMETPHEKIMKPKNLKEFKILKKRYESITLEEIKEKLSNDEFTYKIAEELTGFGNEDTCTLCTNVYEYDCKGCIYVVLTDKFCSGGINEKTFDKIREAKTPIKLLNAFRARAKHMKTLIKDF